MASQTPNLSLEKPTGNENFRRSIINANMDKIDAAVKINADEIAAKETPIGAQAKADAAEGKAKGYTDTKLAELIAAAPGALDTLKELADALGNDPNFAATVINALAGKVSQETYDALQTAFNSHKADNTAHGVGNKVDKVSGKGLSTNDYTTAEKNKLAGIAAGANAYVHPGSGTNPHGTTKADVGLGNVDNVKQLPAAGGNVSGEINMQDNLLTKPYIKDYAEYLSANAAASGTVTLNIETANNFNLTIAGATTLAFSNPSASGRACSITVKINMPATLYAITFPASVKWAGDKIPTFTAGKTAYLTFVTFDGGSRWHGFDGGTDFTT